LSSMIGDNLLINSGNMQKRRPCTFGQSLGRPIFRSISHFVFVTPRRIVQSQRPEIIFGQLY
jgi:hypothetical protein